MNFSIYLGNFSDCYKMINISKNTENIPMVVDIDYQKIFISINY